MNFFIDDEINPWIKDFDMRKHEKELNIFLSLGYNISKCYNPKVDDNILDDKIQNLIQSLETKTNEREIKLNEIMSSFTSKVFEKINENSNKMDTTSEKINTHLITSIKEITGKSNISTHKGQIGENYVLNTLREAYPNAHTESTVSVSHQSDIQFKQKNEPDILIEIKNYSNTVPSKEVEKFKNDLKNTGYKYGIFMSFNQKISLIHNKIEIEKYEDITILYGSCLNYDKASILMPIEFINYLSKTDVSKSNINMSYLSETCDNICISVKELDELYNTLDKNTEKVKKERRTIMSSLDCIHTTLIDSQIECNRIINKIKSKISNEISQFLEVSSIDIQQDFNFLSEKTKNIIELLNLELLKNNIILKVINKDKNQFNLFKEDKKISSICVNKTKIKGTIISTDATMCIDNDNYKKFVEYLLI